MKFKLNPLQQFALFLAVYSSFAVWFNFGEDVLWHLAATLGFALVLFYALSAVSKRKKVIWNTIATSLIIFLVLNFGQTLNDLWYPLTAVFIAVTYKFFFEYKGKPIINPTVFTLLLLMSIAGVIPGAEPVFVSWWGASFAEPLAVILLLVWVLAGLNVWKKWPIFLSFIIPYAVFTYFYGGMDFTKFIFTTGTVYFFTAVMLVEPKTSPILTRNQIIAGVFTAAVYSALLYFKVGASELIAIAAMNLLNFCLLRAGGGMAKLSAV